MLLPFIGLIVFCGVYPKPMIDRIEPSVKTLIAHVEERTGYDEPVPVTPAGLESEHGESGHGESGDHKDEAGKDTTAHDREHGGERTQRGGRAVRTEVAR